MEYVSVGKNNVKHTSCVLPQALLSSEPKSSSCSLLKMTMRELIALALPSADRNTDLSTVPQV